MKNDAIVCNIGHFDIEIDMAWLEQAKGRQEDRDQAAGRSLHVPNGTLDPGAGRGPVGEPRACATGHPSFVMSTSFTNQVMAQLALWTKPKDFPIGVHVLPKKLDEEVARLHLEQAGREADQADADAGRLPAASRPKGRISPNITGTNSFAGSSFAYD